MEVQIISRIHNLPSGQYYNTRSVAITDYYLKEIVVRFDVAKFGHYLHEFIHGILRQQALPSTERRFSVVFYPYINRFKEVSQAPLSRIPK